MQICMHLGFSDDVTEHEYKLCLKYHMIYITCMCLDVLGIKSNHVDAKELLGMCIQSIECMKMNKK